MKFLNDEITSQFIGIGKRLDHTEGYKNKFELLFPKHIITINGEDFSFNDMAINVSKLAGLKKESALYLCNGEIYVQEGRSRTPFDNSKQKTIYINSIKTFDGLQKSAFSNPKRSALNEQKILLAFRCIVGDALCAFEFATAGEMAKEFGYTDVDEAVRVYNECVNTRLKLGKNETQLREILDELSKIGIE